MTVVVQGFGNVGYHAAKFLEEDGAKIVGIVEYDCAIFAEDGLDIEAVAAHRRATGSIKGFAGSETVSAEEGLTYRAADILIPAAKENAVTEENCEKINYSLIVEAANGPVSAGAEAALARRGITILPDLFINAGGVVVSYFEWVKNITHLLRPDGQTSKSHTGGVFAAALEQVSGRPLTDAMRLEITRETNELDLVRSGLEEIMVRALDDILARHKTLPDASLRTAAYAVSIARIAEYYRAIGL